MLCLTQNKTADKMQSLTFRHHSIVKMFEISFEECNNIDILD